MSTGDGPVGDFSVTLIRRTPIAVPTVQYSTLRILVELMLRLKKDGTTPSAVQGI